MTKKPLRIKLRYVVAVTITKCTARAQVSTLYLKARNVRFVCGESFVVVVYLNQN